MDSENSPVDPIDYIARARRLVPLIAAAADRTEKERRIPDDVRRAMHEAGLFRMLLPRSLNGAELEPSIYVQVIETIAAADASTAWCLNQACGGSLSAAYLKPDIAAKIFGPSDAVMAWGPGVGRAIKVDGGYRVSGTWSFCSGGHHATWLGARCNIFTADGKPVLNAGGVQTARSMLTLASAVTWQDVWHTLGLAGTGSDQYTIKDVFVPEDDSFGPEYGLIPDGESPRYQFGKLYGFPAQNLFAPGFAAVSLGVARGMLDAFATFAQEKANRGSVKPLREDPIVQLEYGRCEVKLRAARAFLIDTLRHVWASLEAPSDLPMDSRFALRMAASHAILESKEIVEAMYHAAGAVVVLKSQPFERRLRDMHSVAQHIQGRVQHLAIIGQHLLGLEAETRFV
jgi:alkylation response protein AidB-like acyl-CoA dehydrogenase